MAPKDPKPSPASPRWRRLLINSTALLLGLFILLLWLPYLVPDSFVAGRVRAELRNTLAVPFTLEGATLRGWTRLEVRGLTVGNEGMLAADRIRLDVRPLSLLGSTPRLRRITVTGGSIVPRRLPDGRLNLAGLLKPRMAGRAPVVVEHVMLRDLRVDLSRLWPARSPSLNLDLDLCSPTHPEAYTVRGRGTVALDGQVLLARFGAGFSVLQGPPTESRTTLVAVENASLTAGPRSAPAEFDLTDLDCVFVADRFGARLDGRLALGGDRLHFSLAHRGPAGRRTTSVHLSSRSFNAGGVLALVERLTAPRVAVEEAPWATAQRSPRLEALLDLRGQVALEFGELIVPPHRFGDLRQTITFDAGRFATTGPPFEYNGGTVDARLTLTVAARGAPDWTAQMHVRRVEPRENLRPLLNILLPSVHLLKPFGFDADLAGSGLSVDDLCSNIHGRVALQFGAGYVDIERPPAYVTRVFPSLDTTKVPFKDGHVEGDFKGKILEFDARFHTDIANRLDTFAKGRADLMAETLTVDFGVDTLASLGVKARPGSKLAGSTDIVVARMTGSFNEPIQYQWYEVQAERVASVFRMILRDPVVMLDPTVSVKRKADLVRQRVRSVVGVAVQPLIFTSDLLNGANETVRGFLRLLVGGHKEE